MRFLAAFGFACAVHGSPTLTSVEEMEGDDFFDMTHATQSREMYETCLFDKCAIPDISLVWTTYALSSLSNEKQCPEFKAKLLCDLECAKAHDFEVRAAFKRCHRLARPCSFDCGESPNANFFAQCGNCGSAIAEISFNPIIEACGPGVSQACCEVVAPFEENSCIHMFLDTVPGIDNLLKPHLDFCSYKLPPRCPEPTLMPDDSGDESDSTEAPKNESSQPATEHPDHSGQSVGSTGPDSTTATTDSDGFPVGPVIGAAVGFVVIVLILVALFKRKSGGTDAAATVPEPATTTAGALPNTAIPFVTQTAGSNRGNKSAAAVAASAPPIATDDGQHATKMVGIDPAQVAIHIGEKK